VHHLTPGATAAPHTLPPVPKRTNLFQEVVAIIYETLAGDASKSESAMLPNLLTGELREVDVVLRAQTAGHEMVLAIEAAGRARRPCVDWVEQMIGKHKNLPTDKVVLVSETGFSKQARALALAEQMVPLTPETLASDDPVGEIVNAIPSLWPKTISLKPAGARVWVDRPGEGIKWFRAPADLDVVREDGRSIALRDVFFQLLEANLPRVLAQIGLARIADDIERFFVLRVGPGWTVKVDSAPQAMYARWAEGKTELHRIDALEVTGKATIHVSEIALTHRRLGELDVRYAYGEGTIGGKPALVVVTEDEEGPKATVRLRDDPGDPQDGT
jgi:hypothetical protein